MRAAEVPNFGIAKTVRGLLPRGQRGRNKRRLVVPAIERLMSGIRARKVGALRGGVEGEVVRVGNVVGTITEAARVAQVRGQDRIDGFASLRGRDSCNLPSSQKCIQ